MMLSANHCRQTYVSSAAPLRQLRYAPAQMDRICQAVLSAARWCSSVARSDRLVRRTLVCCKISVDKGTLIEYTTNKQFIRICRCRWCLALTSGCCGAIVASKQPAKHAGHVLKQSYERLARCMPCMGAINSYRGLVATPVTRRHVRLEPGIKVLTFNQPCAPHTFSPPSLVSLGTTAWPRQTSRRMSARALLLTTAPWPRPRSPWTGRRLPHKISRFTQDHRSRSTRAPGSSLMRHQSLTLMCLRLRQRSFQHRVSTPRCGPERKHEKPKHLLPQRLHPLPRHRTSLSVKMCLSM